MTFAEGFGVSSINGSHVMSAKFECVDHPVFAVNDLNVASDAFQRLGFVVPPIGKSPTKAVATPQMAAKGTPKNQ